MRNFKPGMRNFKPETSRKEANGPPNPRPRSDPSHDGSPTRRRRCGPPPDRTHRELANPNGLHAWQQLARGQRSQAATATSTAAPRLTPGNPTPHRSMRQEQTAHQCANVVTTARQHKFAAQQPAVGSHTVDILLCRCEPMNACV